MVKVGCCSWAEKTLIKSGEFYPNDVKTAKGRLEYYASKFDTVEVDSSYYAIPDQRVTSLWAERTPRNFIFHFKVYGALTGHGVDIRAIPKDVVKFISKSELKGKFAYIKERSIIKLLANRFVESISPINKSGKLGLLVFQYPPWFLHRKENLAYMLFCKEIIGDKQVAVEFRHGSWFKPERRDTLLQLLEKHNITHIIADEPQYGSLATVPFVAEATTETVFFRLHGRNKANWLRKGLETAQKYNYLYSEDELKTFMPYINEFSKNMKKVYVMFNNCFEANAITNALEMVRLLK